MENDKKEQRELQSLMMFTAPAGEHILKNTRKRVLIILWHHAVFVKIGIMKKCMNIPLKVFPSDTVAEVWQCKSCKKKYL